MRLKCNWPSCISPGSLSCPQPPFQNTAEVNTQFLPPHPPPSGLCGSPNGHTCPAVFTHFTELTTLFTTICLLLNSSISINSTRLELCLVHRSLPRAEKGAPSVLFDIYVSNKRMEIHCSQSALSITQQNIYFCSTEMENCFLSQILCGDCFPQWSEHCMLLTKNLTMACHHARMKPQVFPWLTSPWASPRLAANLLSPPAPLSCSPVTKHWLLAVQGGSDGDSPSGCPHSTCTSPRPGRREGVSCCRRSLLPHTPQAEGAPPGTRFPWPRSLKETPSHSPGLSPTSVFFKVLLTISHFVIDSIIGLLTPCFSQQDVSSRRKRTVVFSLVFSSWYFEN